MSLARNLVDLYVLASAATKVGSAVIASQTSAVCHHVKTSSILNPTTVQEQHTAVEVPLPKDEESVTIKVEKETLTTKEGAEPKPVSTTTTTTTTVSTPESTTSTTSFTPEPVIPIEPVIETKPVIPVEPVIESEPVVETTKTIESVKTPLETPQVEKIVETAKVEVKKRELKESRIPTSRFGRLWNYGTLATGMGMGAINETFKRATGLSNDSSGKKKRRYTLPCKK